MIGFKLSHKEIMEKEDLWQRLRCHIINIRSDGGYIKSYEENMTTSNDDIISILTKPYSCIKVEFQFFNFVISTKDINEENFESIKEALTLISKIR